MTSKITGNRDIGIEVSAKVIEAYLHDKVVGVHSFPGAMIRVGAVKVSFEDSTGDAMRLAVQLSISHGTITPLPNWRLRGLQLAASAVFPAKLEPVPGSEAVQLRLIADQIAIGIAWKAGARDVFFPKTMYPQGPPPDDVVVGLALRPLLARVTAAPLVLPVVRVTQSATLPPNLELDILNGVSVHQIEARSLAQDPSRLLVGATWYERGGQANLANKSRNVLASPDHFALTLSPEFVRDSIVCPSLATMLEVDGSALCAACGSASAVSLKEKFHADVSSLNLTGIDVQCVPGALRIALTMSADVDFAQGDGTGLLNVSFEIVDGKLRAHEQVVGVDLEIDSPWGMRILSGGASELFAEAIETLLEAEASKWLVGRSWDQSIDLPVEIGDQRLQYTGVTIDEDGVTIAARLSLPMPVSRSPRLEIAAHTIQSLRKVVASGTDGGTCIKSGYHYEIVDIENTVVLEVLTSNLAEPFAVRWSISGIVVDAGGGDMGIPISSSNGTSVAELQVNVTNQGRGLTLQTRSKDGNYSMLVRCSVDDGVDEYINFMSVDVHGRLKEYDDDYFRDRVRCMQALTPTEARVPWPASAGGGRVPGVEAPNIFTEILGARTPGPRPSPIDGLGQAFRGGLRSSLRVAQRLLDVRDGVAVPAEDVMTTGRNLNQKG